MRQITQLRSDILSIVDSQLKDQLKGAKQIAKTPHASVFKFHSNRFGCDVAVKIVSKDDNKPGQYIDKFLQREIEITQEISHPFIIRTFEVSFPVLFQLPFS